MGKQKCKEKYLKKFPAYYRTLPCNCPREGSLYEYSEFIAYRACLGIQVSEEDFLSYYELGDIDKDWDASRYSVSLFTETTRIKGLLKSSRYHSAAKGIVKHKNGPIRKSEKSGHVDWWLYEDANPVNDFEVIRI